MKRSTRLKASLAALACIAAFASVSPAMFMRPDTVPVDRVVKNAEAYVKEHADDASGHYVLGRAHALAFIRKSEVVAVYMHQQKPGGLPALVDDIFQPGAANNPVPTEAQLVDHLQSGVESLQKAVQMQPKDARYHLTLGFLVESGTAMADKVNVLPQADPSAKATEKKDIPKLSDYWHEQAIAAYWDAYTLAIDKDLKVPHRPLFGLRELVSHEAGNAYLKLVKARGVKDDEKPHVAAIEESLKKFAALPPGPVTPIVFALDRSAPLDELLAPDVTVSFDLDGTGRPQRWPWVQPGTAILVYDPQHTGKITSGRQLFGSATFWLLPPDGYRAMDMLDDNRDGMLSGDELKGLALWFDRNSNGISDPGEVIAIEKSPVESVSTQSLSQTGESPSNPLGLHLKDGRALPTYDWVAHPVK